jgi:hypothetical protein
MFNYGVSFSKSYSFICWIITELSSQENTIWLLSTTIVTVKWSQFYERLINFNEIRCVDTCHAALHNEPLAELQSQFFLELRNSKAE